MTVSRRDRVVVVGNGIAGRTACDSLRDSGFDGEITVVGAEHHPPYSRPALSKAALVDGGELTAHRLPEPTHGATELFGTRARHLDIERRRVSLDDGTDLPYDGLVIASGSRARRLAAGDGDGQAEGAVDEVTLRELDDAVVLRRRLAGRPSVAVVGDGPLGTEIASGCLAAGCEVTLVSRGRPLADQLGPYLSDLFTYAAREHGLRLAYARSAGVASSGGHPVVVLDDGAHLEAELVISAVGDVPNVGWLATSGLLTDGELRVDTRGRLRPDIVAAGDVAAFPTRHGIRRVPLWTSAVERSRGAAAALVHGDAAAEVDFHPYFWTEQFGLSLKACGSLPAPGVPEVVDGDPATGKALLRWPRDDGAGTAVALNYRYPVPKLRRLSRATPGDGI
ncbi:NAD(P)/FAD-dependent oxidoreductase [Saccharomonospora iraqiensis]|uniref:NAD(P)/FAD-dependent oxidoreductase n=1 Tax=Saccharomonospora iraqiensis TaxID=52698 RepID=UPI00022E7C08